MIEKPTKVELRQEFTLLNARFFRGLLPEIPIRWVAAKRWWGMYHPPQKGLPNGRIRLSSLDQPHGWGWRGILLHEMVHAWLWHTDREVPVRDSTLLEDHSEAFTSVCNALGARLGIPLVNTHDSWAWPWTVSSVFDQTDVHDE